MIIRRYSELIRLETFEERFKYLQLQGQVGAATFGFDRPINQELYHSQDWQDLRNEIIIRDNGCDLGVPGYEIKHRIIIHHLNPITEEMIIDRDPIIFDPENLITTCLRTHNAIHFSDDAILHANKVVERRPNDMIPWR